MRRASRDRLRLGDDRFHKIAGGLIIMAFGAVAVVLFIFARAIVATMQGLLHFVNEQNAGRHGVGDPESLADILFRLPHQGAHQSSDVETEGWSPRLVSEGLGEGALARSGDSQKQHTAGPGCRTGLEQGPPAERLECRQAPQAVERLRPATERK